MASQTTGTEIRAPQPFREAPRFIRPWLPLGRRAVLHPPFCPLLRSAPSAAVFSGRGDGRPRPPGAPVPQSLPEREYSARDQPAPNPNTGLEQKDRDPRSQRYLGDWGRPSIDALASPQSLARSPPEGLPPVQ